jgi:hypothetical protein
MNKKSSTKWDEIRVLSKLIKQLIKINDQILMIHTLLML